MYEYNQDFSVKYCDVDFKDELKVSALLAYLEEVACASADELGFGYSYIKPKGYAFMLTNIRCEFSRAIPLGEIIKVKTWPTIPSHVIFGREYQVLSSSNEVLVNASSRWCLVDMTTGKVLQSKLIDNQDYSTYNSTKTLENVRWKLPAFAVEGDGDFMMTVANSEYDHNMHVNNTRYADYCLNCFSVEELRFLRVKTFMISYVKQCKEGETLRFYRKRVEEGEYLIQGINQQAEIVTQAYFYFEEI